MNMRRAPLLWLLVVAALALGPALATPLAHADDSPCDPTNGGYICDGTGKLSQPSEEAEEDIAMEGEQVCATQAQNCYSLLLLHSIPLLARHSPQQ